MQDMYRKKEMDFLGAFSPLYDFQVSCLYGLNVILI